ncbi:MAG: Sec-independent protein translocase protein TatB [Acidimicrobiales bacterium]
MLSIFGEGGQPLVAFVGNVGGGEILVIAIVALVVVGPEQLPGLLRKAGRYAAQIKSMGDSVRNEFMAGAEEMDPRNWSSETPRRGAGTADDPILPRKPVSAPVELPGDTPGVTKYDEPATDESAPVDAGEPDHAGGSADPDPVADERPTGGEAA